MPIQNNTGDSNIPDFAPPAKPSQEKENAPQREPKRGKNAQRNPEKRTA